ncbi:hypothetical protein E4U57_000305 [Claviceps arundinis]|uniref:Altered inheritance of mitochondria protein 32 n=1 Tax=Claviceps arundinis TaxID=1623583 RepID=A0A9P7MUJ2_9HYPO|nr:hypothetical protein E4U57_000305 [Claviceps arundinis]KAG5969512.1 hypothetical protein E4U56_008270 [Claviceps arundinis]
MPDGLEIDHTSRLNGVIARYSEHVIVCTGQDDWASKIENENGGDNLVAELRDIVVPKGVRGDSKDKRFVGVSLLNSSFPSSISPLEDTECNSVYLLPSFKYVAFLPRKYKVGLLAIAQGYLLPEEARKEHTRKARIGHKKRSRDVASQRILSSVQDVRDVMVLICGHGGRDARCGTFGPLLRDEFETKLAQAGIKVARGAVEVHYEKKVAPWEKTKETKEVSWWEKLKQEGMGREKKTARVGLISHIGGHSFAGNVIIYIPPDYEGPGGEKHELAGCGIWYGRVEPKHVEGLIEETIVKGVVVKDLCRGILDSKRQMERMQPNKKLVEAA